jgi:uncharacterized cupredoxin-like copper-binding protein
MKRWVIVSILSIVSCIALAACGESNSQSSNSSSSPSSSSANAQTVNILLGEMYIKSDITSFKVGTPYHLVLKNEGKVIHEFTIAKKVPGGDQNSRDSASVKDVDNIQPGQTTTFDFTFQEPAPSAGMEFECSYPGHYEMGMHQDITVQ